MPHNSQFHSNSFIFSRTRTCFATRSVVAECWGSCVLLLQTVSGNLFHPGGRLVSNRCHDCPALTNNNATGAHKSDFLLERNSASRLLLGGSILGRTCRAAPLSGAVRHSDGCLLVCFLIHRCLVNLFLLLLHLTQTSTCACLASCPSVSPSCVQTTFAETCHAYLTRKLDCCDVSSLGKGAVISTRERKKIGVLQN